MWTISSFPGKARRAAVVLAGVFLVAAGLCGYTRLNAAENNTAPDAPLPAKPKPEVPRDVAGEKAKLDKPVELKSLTVHKLEKARDLSIIQLAGARFLQKATEPIVIEATLKGQSDTHAKDSFPVIVLNGVKLKNTRRDPDAPDKLIAFLPDRKLLKEDKNTVEIQWVGGEEAGSTEKPKTFGGKDVKD